MRFPPEFVSALYRDLTWTYHAEAMAKNQYDRDTFTESRLELNKLILEATDEYNTTIQQSDNQQSSCEKSGSQVIAGPPENIAVLRWHDVKRLHRRRN